MTELRTTRLRLRSTWTDADLDPLAALNADPDVMRYIADGTVRTRQETAERLQAMRRAWDDDGFGLFAVETADQAADGRAFLGWVGLAVPHFLPEVLPAVEIGWRLRRDAWGHGYATEAARAVVEFATVERGLDRLVSIRHADNHRSKRVMTKLGLVPERRTVVPATGVPVVVHATVPG